jgi:alanine-glyoxylate transaminase / serine-glyoxylate transaminase / serine-pyruvate transaminase
MPATPPTNTPRRAGRHFLQIPGPTPVPDRILRAIDMPTIDHRGPEFGKLGLRVLEKLKTVFKTKNHVFIYPSSGTGAWTAALVNTLSPGDHVLMVETGHFASLWKGIADKLGLKAELIVTDWRRGAPPELIEERLKHDTGKTIKAVCVVHSETSTGCVSRLAEIRAAMDRAGHPAMLMVDTISSLGSIDLRHDAWGIDISIGGSQKGLMLPPGLSFTAVSDKALAAHKTATLPRTYWDWSDMLANNAKGYFPYTPATNMLYGLDTAIDMLTEEGLDNVFARHIRHGEAARAAVKVWGLELQCAVESEQSPVLTTIRLPDGHNADALRQIILDKFDLSLGTGLSKVAGRVFRIGHLGDINDLTVIAALAGVEMGLGLAGVPHKPGGVQAAMARLSQ